MAFRPNIYQIVIAGVVLITIIFLINMVWFKPFFIHHFFYREMVSALKVDPQTATKAKAPFFHKRYRDKLNDISPEGLQKESERIERNLNILREYNDAYLRSRNL